MISVAPPKNPSGPLLLDPRVRSQDARGVGRANRSAVVRAARWYGPLSRRQLSEITGLGSATLFYIVDELLGLNLLEEIGVAEAERGRRPSLYRFNAEAFYAIGVSVSGLGRLEGVVTNLDGQVLARADVEIPADASPERIVAEIGKVSRGLVKQANLEWEQFGGVGVAMHGQVDLNTGMVLLDGYRRFGHAPMPEMLEKETGLPAYVTSRRIAVALGEKWCGAGRNLDTFLCINAGIGVGVSMILQGRAYTGNADLAGRHIGHMVVDDGGPLCSCGKHGCLQMFAGGKAIAERVTWDLRHGVTSSISTMIGEDPANVTADIVAIAASLGDPYAVGVIQNAGRHLGVAIAWLIDVLAPQAVIVAGHLVRAEKVLFDSISQAVSTRAMPEVVEGVPIIPAGLGQDAHSVGAAILVLERKVTL